MSIYNTIAIFKKEPQVKDNTEQMPSRKLTYPTWGKGKSSSNMPYQRDMLIPWRVYQQHQRYPHHASKISVILFHATNRRCHHGKKVYIHNFEFSLVPTSCLDLPLKRKHVTTAPPPLPRKLSVLEIMEGLVADDFPCFPKVNDFFLRFQCFNHVYLIFGGNWGKTTFSQTASSFCCGVWRSCWMVFVGEKSNGGKHIKKQKLSSLSLCAGTPLCGWDQFAFFRLFRKGLQINRQAAALTVNVDFRDVWSHWGVLWEISACRFDIYV